MAMGPNQKAWYDILVKTDPIAAAKYAAGFDEPTTTASSASSVSASSSAPVSSPSLSELYQQYLGRSPDAEGLQYWSSKFGSTIDPNEVAIFKQATEDARTAGIEPPAPTQTTTATQSSTSSASSQRQQEINDWVYNSEPKQYQDLYTALQSGKAKVVNDPDAGFSVVDANGRALQGVNINPETGQIVVPTSNGNLFVSTQIGPGGTLAPIAPENYNKQVTYQSYGNDWDKYGGLALAAAGMFGAPYLSSLIGGATGLTGASLAAATGATIGGAGAALTGGDVLKGALLGGAGGYLSGSLASGATPGTDLGMNSQLTPAAIEAGLGTPGYGFNASAAQSGLFNPAIIGAGAYTQTSYPYDMADFLAADVKQLYGQVGSNIPAIEQNLVASGVDPLVAADVANQVTLNPNISQYDLTNYIASNFGGNVYDVNMATQYPTSQIPGEGGLLSNVAGLPVTSTTPSTTTPSTLKPSQIANLVKAGLSLAGAGAIASNMGGGMGGAGALPTQGVPTNTPEYYQAIQQYYNTYMPDVPRDVATPLQQWYDSKYGA